MPSQSPKELETLRFSSLLAAARLAARFRTPLKEMKRLMELAYYQETRTQRLKMKEVRDLMKISMSKVGLLSKELKEQFAQPELEHGLPRRILALLWADALTEVKIAQALSEYPPEDISATIARMVEKKTIKQVPGRTVRYALGDTQYRLVQEPWMARIDALNNLMASVARIVEARFIDGDQHAMSRTLNFRARPEDMVRLQKLYEEQIFPLICELDAAVVEGEPVLPVQFSVFWAPEGPLEEPSSPENSKE